MNSLVLTILLFATDPHAPSTLYLRVGPTWESTLLRAELTRDWSRTADGRLAGQRFNAVASRLRVVWIERCDMLPTELPAWSFDRHGRFLECDRRAFRCSTWPLLYCAYLIDRHNWDRRHYEWWLDVAGWWAEDAECYNRSDEPIEPIPPWLRPGIRLLFRPRDP